MLNHPGAQVAAVEGIGRVHDVRQGSDGLLYVLTDGSNGKLVGLLPEKRMNAAFRKQLFEAAEQAAYPAEPVLDRATGVAALDVESMALVAHVFDLFGITALQAGDADIDRVLNTACTLSAEVAVHVYDLADVNGDLAALPESENWHEDYRAYISALWQGDREAITRQAVALGLPAGIPNGSLPLQDGPLG